MINSLLEYIIGFSSISQKMCVSPFLFSMPHFSVKNDVSIEFAVKVNR